MIKLLKQNKGFTLIEIIIAVALTTILVGGALTLINSTEQTNVAVVQQSNKINAAQSVLETVRKMTSLAIGMEIRTVDDMSTLTTSSTEHYILSLGGKIYLDGYPIVASQDFAFENAALTFKREGATGSKTLECYMTVDGAAFPSNTSTQSGGPSQSLLITGLLGEEGIVDSTASGEGNCVYYITDTE